MPQFATRNRDKLPTWYSLTHSYILILTGAKGIVDLKTRRLAHMQPFEMACICMVSSPLYS